MTPARNSPSARTLGIQLVAISTVLALIARMLRTASRPMPAIVKSRNATTEMILARIESLESMAKVLFFLSVREISTHESDWEMLPRIKNQGTYDRVNESHRRITGIPKMHAECDLPRG